jgi:predicted alpha/beta-hydrolase family hydrolase
MRLYPAAGQAAPTFVLAHGAGAGHDHPWMTRVAQGLADRGVRVVTFNFAYREAGRTLPDPGPVLEEAFRSIWAEVARTTTAKMFAGGKSMGGRISSQVAARRAFNPAPDGLIFFGYPLHPPGKPAQRRDRHLPNVQAGMLFLSGTRDPFASPDELRELVDELNLSAERKRSTAVALELFEGGDHSLIAAKKVDPEGRLLDRAMDDAAAWMTRLTRD